MIYRSFLSQRPTERVRREGRIHSVVHVLDHQRRLWAAKGRSWAFAIAAAAAAVSCPGWSIKAAQQIILKAPAVASTAVAVAIVISAYVCCAYKTSTKHNLLSNGKATYLSILYHHHYLYFMSPPPSNKQLEYLKFMTTTAFTRTCSTATIVKFLISNEDKTSQSH